MPKHIHLKFSLPLRSRVEVKAEEHSKMLFFNCLTATSDSPALSRSMPDPIVLATLSHTEITLHCKNRQQIDPSQFSSIAAVVSQKCRFQTSSTLPTRETQSGNSRVKKMPNFLHVSDDV
jgi:hypothetical protein